MATQVATNWKLTGTVLIACNCELQRTTHPWSL